MKKPSTRAKPEVSATTDYTGLVGGITEVLEIARRTSARAVNAVMTATYWEVGRRIVEFEKGAKPQPDVRDYLTALPDERTLADEFASARKKLEARKP